MKKAPKLRNDCFSLPTGVRWTPVEEALALLEARLQTVVDTEEIAVDTSDGRILANAIIAPRSHPPCANSAVDGYALSGGLTRGSHCVELGEGRAAAGDGFKGVVTPGHAIRILTGAVLPNGADTVVLQEDVLVEGNKMYMNGPLKRGANARNAGEDVVQGTVLFAVGHQIQPQDIGVLISVGVAQVKVFRPLRVALVSTGMELCVLGTDVRLDQIFDVNRPMLQAILQRWGMQVVDMGITPDDANLLRQVLDQAAEQADVILTSGGASAGDEDHMSTILAESGNMVLWRIAVKPGRPLALGMWSGVPVFGLPGNPVAAFVCTLVFARPALMQLSGASFVTPMALTLPAAFTKDKKAGRREYLRARLRNGVVETFASEGSGRVSGLSWANGLVELPDEAMEITAGQPVRFFPYSSFGL